MKKKLCKTRPERRNRLRARVKSQLRSLREETAGTTKLFPPKQWSLEEPEAILDYLHGDIPSDQVKACCYYEYARASELFQAGRNLYDTHDEIQRRRSNTERSIYSVIAADFCPLLRVWRGLEILICEGYPEHAWRELTDAQRQDICIHFVRSRTLPIATDSFILKSLGVFDRFIKEADASLANKRRHTGKAIPRGQYPAIVGDEDDAVKYVVLTLDYGRGKEAMSGAVTRWLEDEANKRLFERFYKPPIHKQNRDSPDRYKELLKYLAAWRLYDELGFKAACTWTKDHRCERGDALLTRPFFREKPRQRPGGKYCLGPLFKERRQWGTAINAARSFLAAEIDGKHGIT